MCVVVDDLLRFEVRQDPGVSLLMLLINVDERAPKIRPRSDTNVDEIGSQSDPSPIFCGDGRGGKRSSVAKSDICVDGFEEGTLVGPSRVGS